MKKFLDDSGLLYVWNKIINKIPTKTSQIENDTNLIDEEYYKTNTGEIKDYWANTETIGVSSIVQGLNHTKDWALAHFELFSNKTQDIVANVTSETLYPSAKAVADYVRGYELIYDDATGFEANDEDVGDAWHLTGLDLSKYRRLKFYICSAGDSNTNWSPSHIVELDLDNRARGANGHFTAGHTAVCPNSTGRFHNVIVSVSADKTALAFNRSNRYNVSTSATAIGGRYCYRIEGYYE